MTTDVETKKYYIEPELDSEMDRIDRLSTVAPRNVLLVGPQGCGKTGLYHHFVTTFHRPSLKMQCGVIVDPDEWFGTTTIRDGGTETQTSRFTEMVRTPGAAILLDDFGRSISPKILSGLFGLLDDTAREQYIPVLDQTVQVAEGVIFFGTYNRSVKGSYIGQDNLDQALVDRFRVIQMGYPSIEVETQIGQDYGLNDTEAAVLVKLLNKLREEYEFSTRQLIQIAEGRAIGASWADAFRYSCLYAPGTNAGNKDSDILQQIQIQTGEGT